MTKLAFSVYIWVVLDKDDLIPTLRQSIDGIKATHTVLVPLSQFSTNQYFLLWFQLISGLQFEMGRAYLHCHLGDRWDSFGLVGIPLCSSCFCIYSYEYLYNSVVTAACCSKCELFSSSVHKPIMEQSEKNICCLTCIRCVNVNKMWHLWIFGLKFLEDTKKIEKIWDLWI